MIVSFVAIWVSGAIVGYAYGLDAALRNKAFARGFLEGFCAPFRFIKSVITGKDIQ